MTMQVELTRLLWEQDELPDGFKWIEKLSPRHQRLFYAEVQYEWSRYCATADARGLMTLFEDWAATAEADADPAHAAFLLGPKDEGDYTTRPAASSLPAIR